MVEREPGTLQLKDAHADEKAVIIVRRVERNVGIALSLEGNGDIDIFFKPENLKRFISALQRFAEVGSESV